MVDLKYTKYGKICDWVCRNQSYLHKLHVKKILLFLVTVYDKQTILAF